MMKCLLIRIKLNLDCRDSQLLTFESFPELTFLFSLSHDFRWVARREVIGMTSEIDERSRSA